MFIPTGSRTRRKGDTMVLAKKSKPGQKPIRVVKMKDRKKADWRELVRRARQAAQNLAPTHDI